MERVFYNGHIRTLEKAYPECEALAEKDGVILYLGTSEEVLRRASPDAERIDLRGGHVLPGFADTICT